MMVTKFLSDHGERDRLSSKYNRSVRPGIRRRTKSGEKTTRQLRREIAAEREILRKFEQAMEARRQGRD